MATHWIPQNFFLSRNQRLLLRVLCVLTMTWNVSGNENAAQIQLRGELGGNVSFSCPVERGSFYFLYLQKVKGKDIFFVNGHHSSRQLTGAWENTWMDQDKFTVHMHSLNVSHEGDYTCDIAYSAKRNTVQTFIHLSITANYSKPEVKVLHSDEIYSLVNCSSHGGYPSSEIGWNSGPSQMMKDVNKSVTRDAVTMTFNISSTAYFNCSMGEIQFISCSAGGIDSQLFSVCKPKDRPPPTFHTSVITAAVICVAILFFVVVGLLVLRLRQKCKRRQREAAPADVRLESANGQQETLLTGVAVLQC